MFNILTHQGKANQHDLKIPPYTNENSKDQNASDQDVEKEEHSSIASGNANWCNHFGNQSGSPSETLKLLYQMYPDVPLLRIYPKDVAPYQKVLCSTVFIAALYLIAKTWKYARCQSINVQIQKMCFIYRMEFYLAIKTRTSCILQANRQNQKIS